ncbi:MAG: ABC transporter permease [Brevinematales bacterium]|nr:ABC transporter permease [Brevinematales bacterium]
MIVKKVVLFIATRYINLSGKDVISKIALVAFLSITVGVATSVVVLSITNGFREDLKEKMIGKESHISVIGRGLGIKDYDFFANEIKKIFPWVVDADPYYEGQGLLRKWGDNIHGTLIMGITTNTIKRYQKHFKLLKGSYELKRGEILLAETIAYNLRATVGSEIEVIVKPPLEGELPRIRTFIVKGIFSTGYGDYDNILSAVLIEDAQSIFKVGKLAYGISVMVDDVEKVKEYKYQILNKFSGEFIVLTWQDTNRNLFEAMYNQKTVMMLILFLFFTVVSFGIIGTMMSLALDKKSEIAILKAIGMRNIDILNIFVIAGALLGVFGSIVGLLIGVLISINLEAITLGIENFVNFIIFNLSYPVAKMINPYVSYPEKFEFFKSNVYYIKSFPTKVEFLDLFLISVFATSVSILAGLFPALRASKLKPSEILRNE